MLFRNIMLGVLVIISLLSTTYASVSLKVDGLAATIKNDHVELDFKSDATINTLYVNGTNIAVNGEKTFYLDWISGEQGVFTPSSIHVVEQTSSRVHFYWVQNSDNVFNIELHYVMVDGLYGIYSYAKYTNDKLSNLTVEETKMVYKFDGSILVQGTSGQREGTTPTIADLDGCTSIQDSTWQYPNGTYYSKYDFAAYIRETNYQGVFGNGYGAFVISPSREYHGGGPMKQDLTVHQECLVANYFMSGHLTGTPGINAPPGWVHIYGPFLLYFPTGDNGQIMSAVHNQVDTEKAAWPYGWLHDNDYPIARGSIIGYADGQRLATIVVWDSVEEEFDLQELGYLYTTNTDSAGYFEIHDIRPGQYKIAAYPLAGQGSDNEEVKTLNLVAGQTRRVHFYLPEPENITWSLGKANRRSDEFNFADQPRNYQWEWKTPVTNNFTIGQSNPKTDWYYAQSQPGHWYIKYQDTKDENQRTLRIALAATSKSHLQIIVNGHEVGDEYFEDDQAISRSAMQSGHFTSLVYTVNTTQIVDGENTIDLLISFGQIMYDAISLQGE